MIRQQAPEAASTQTNRAGKPTVSNTSSSRASFLTPCPRSARRTDRHYLSPSSMALIIEQSPALRPR